MSFKPETPISTWSHVVCSGVQSSTELNHLTSGPLDRCNTHWTIAAVCVWSEVTLLHHCWTNLKALCHCASEKWCVSLNPCSLRHPPACCVCNGVERGGVWRCLHCTGWAEAGAVCVVCRCRVWGAMHVCFGGGWVFDGLPQCTVVDVKCKVNFCALWCLPCIST